LFFNKKRDQQRSVRETDNWIGSSPGADVRRRSCQQRNTTDGLKSLQQSHSTIQHSNLLERLRRKQREKKQDSPTTDLRTQLVNSTTKKYENR